MSVVGAWPARWGIGLVQEGGEAPQVGRLGCPGGWSVPEGASSTSNGEACWGGWVGSAQGKNLLEERFGDSC